MAPPQIIGVTPKLAGGGSQNPDLVSNIQDRLPTPVVGPKASGMATAPPDTKTI